MAAGQAGMTLHTMAILQAYQADVLKEMDEVWLLRQLMSSIRPWTWP